MVELYPPRRRAEQFARALEGDLRSTDPRLQHLLDTVSHLAAVPLVEPRAEFRDALRTRLLEAAAEQPPAEAGAAREHGEYGDTGDTAASAHEVLVGGARAARRRRRLVATATGMVLVGGGTGVAAASEQALPGDVLYPVKRTIETVQVTLAQGAAAEGRALLERASTRLEEADALGTRIAAGRTDVAAGDLRAVRTALDDFAADASTGGERLLDAYDASGDPSDVRTLRDFTADSHRVLADLARMLPPQVQPQVMAADETVVVLDNMAVQACPECTSGAALPALPTQPVVLPQLGTDASPHPPGTDPQPGEPAHERRAETPDKRGDTDHRTGGPDQRRHAPGGNTPGLPGVDLGEPARQQGDDGPGAGGATGPQQQPRVDLGDALDDPAPLPSRQPRRTDGPGLGDVTGPLTGPSTGPSTAPVEPGSPPVESRRQHSDGDGSQGSQEGTRERGNPLRDTLDGLL